MNRRARRAESRKRRPITTHRRPKHPLPWWVRIPAVLLGIVIILGSVALEALGYGAAGRSLPFAVVIGALVIFVAIQGRF